MSELNTRSRNTTLWIGGAVLAILLFGCMTAFAAGIWLIGSSRAVTTTDRGARSTISEEATALPAVALPPARVIIATPEAGVDYESAVLANIYEQVNPSVVNVTVLGQNSIELPDGVHPPGIDPEDFLPVSTGSGFVWDTAGHIVTNNHVVADAEEVQITFSDGASAIAEVVGADEDSDLAVLRIDQNGYNLVPVRAGRMDDVQVGMRVAAIGNPFGLEGTLTTGIVSAIGRTIPARENFSIPDSIQTDAAINPGNSGGPLLNEHGELIGVNAQIRSEVRSNSGVGFAIPVSIVLRVVPALIESGAYQHSYIGVSGGTFSPICAGDLGLPKEIRGALISQVLPSTPASRAGLRGGARPSGTHYPSICPEQAGGDLIVAIDGEPVTKFDDVLSFLQRNTSPGDRITLRVWRDGEFVEIEVVLAARPETAPS